jgi:putative ABC transport system permease protein
VLAWTVIISLGSGIIFGIAPAWHGTRTNLNDSLKESSRSGGESLGARRLRSVLVISEVALAMMLLIGAGLLIRSFVRLRQVNPGFEPRHIVTMQLAVSRVKYPERPLVADFYNRLLRRLNALPGVSGAALTMSLPPNGLQVSDTFLTQTIEPVDDSKAPMGSILSTTPGYFRTLGVPILRGRDFNDHDKADSPRVVIINDTLARKFFAQKNPIGARFKEGGTDRRDNPWMEIVGVVGDVKYEGLEVPTAPTYYLPFAQAPFRQMSLVVSTSLPAASVVASIREEVRALDPEVPVAKISTAEQLVSESVAQPRFRTFLIGIFSAVAMLLAAMGIYGVVSYSVSQRTREIGIRMALGAQRRDVLKLVVRQAMALTLVGVVFGLLGALALTRLTSTLLFGIGTNDPATFVCISILLSIVALLASYFPARRAATVNPVAALAHE